MKSTDEKKAQTLILGLGNELRGDDAVGLLVVRELRRRLSGRSDLVIREASASGLTLLDEMTGHRQLVVVDAIQTKGGQPGNVYRLSEEDLSALGSIWSAHQMALKTVLQTGRSCGCALPDEVVVWAVEVADVQTWRRGCSGEVQAAISQVTRRIIEEIGSECPGDEDIGHRQHG